VCYHCYLSCSKIPFSGKWAESIATSPFPPSETEKKNKFLDFAERGKPNDIAHCPIISSFYGFLNARNWNLELEKGKKKKKKEKEAN